ncbi:hypothetical protein HNR44_003177 [Geomicrobium halophilum]|uniref:Uncharacterized protein n=1 Tax=Geomicrobium halophilum TaxID=549000 RepID=A0A841Q0H2_9BACL|nr:hypothetical protein [Geomicrobium halophilum]
MEPTRRYDAIISAIDLDAICHVGNKKSQLGAPEELNYAAMVFLFLSDMSSGSQRSKTW